MTIEESIQVLCANVMVAVDRADMSEACSKMVEDALNMAIASLEAWERVKDDIHEYETDCMVSADCQDCMDCNVIMFKSIYQIIDKHLQEVTE